MKKIVYIILSISFLFNQELLFSDNFDDGNYDGWDYYHYNAGWHDEVMPEVVDGRVEITTHDQQNNMLVTGNEEWSNYTLEFDARIEQSLDDGYKGIYVTFYLTNPYYFDEGHHGFDSAYRLRIKGRTDEWFLVKIVSGQPEEIFAQGSFNVSVGIDYHCSIEITDSNISVYLNEVGSEPAMLTQASLPEVPLESGMIGFGGSDDRISIDNVVVTGASSEPEVCDQELSVDCVPADQSEISNLFDADGIPSDLQGVVSGDYVQKIDIWGGGGYYSHTYMMMCLEEMADGVLVRGSSDDVDPDRIRIGLDPEFVDMLDFNGLGWINPAEYVQGSEWYLELNSMWGSDFDSHIEIWMASETPFESLGYGLIDEYDDDFGSISLTTYSVFEEEPDELFSDNFDDGNYDGWDYYHYNAGWHDEVMPEVVDGRVEITTHDQQNNMLVTGNEEWSNYTLEFDARIEQSLDDGYKGIYVTFYLTNPYYFDEGHHGFDSAYRLRIKGRTDEWFLVKIVSGQPEEIFAQGSFNVSVGIDYHCSIEITDSNISVYLNEVGSEPAMLTQASLPEVPLESGMIGFGGSDDRISIDNVVVTGASSEPEVCDQELSVDCVPADQSEISNLFDADGIPSDLQGVVSGDYVQKIDIWGGGGYYSHTYMMMCLEEMADGVLVRGSSDDVDPDRIRIGLDPEFVDMLDFNGLGWINPAEYVQGSEWYLELNSMWGSDFDSHIEIWMASETPFESLGYGLIDEYDDDFGSIEVAAYQINGTATDVFLEITDVNLENLMCEQNCAATLDVYMTNQEPVYGFQFSIPADTQLNLIIDSVYGGSADESGFSLSNNSETIIGFSMTGSSIPSGDGVLVHANITIDNVEGILDLDINSIAGYNGSILTHSVGMPYHYIPVLCIPGDVNADDSIDVLDVVQVVGIILETIIPTDMEFCAADFNEDGEINVVDVVLIVNEILGGQLYSYENIEDAILSQSDNKVLLKSNGQCAGLQLNTSGCCSISPSRIPTGWHYSAENGVALLFSTDGSTVSEMEFEYTGDLVIESALIADWSGHSVIAAVETIPEAYELFSAYPNPFNPVTTFHYGLPEDSHVNLAVYDLTGRQIAELVNRDQYAGNFQVNWNADQFASGLYIVRLDAGNVHQTQKVMLLK